MENTTELARQVARLQRRVHVLTAVLFGMLIVGGIVWARESEESQVVRVQTVEAERISAKSIVIRRTDPGSSSIRLSANKGGASLHFRDSEGNTQVLLHEHGFKLQDTKGGHSLYLGLNPGPGELHAPFIQLRDREQKERFQLGLHGESDSPYVTMWGEDPRAHLELAPDSVIIDTDKAQAKVGIRNGTPELRLDRFRNEEQTESIMITPATVLPSNRQQK